MRNELSFSKPFAILSETLTLAVLYMGSPQYFIQREYYKPTYTFGFRWGLQHEK